MALHPQHVRRYTEIVALLIKYGHGDLVKNSGFAEDLPAGHREAPPVPPKAEELAADLEKLGPTFIKLGQLLSTRADFLPPAYLEALARLQDKVEPFPYSEVEAIVPVELGVRISKGFAHFEKEPMAAASLGQVHRATLRDGRQVAVKVQRPEIREKMMGDLDALQEIAEFLDAHTAAGQKYAFARLVDQFRKSLLAELDYRQEAQNLHVLGERLRHFPNIRVPAAIDDFTSSRVLTMEYIEGTKITALSPLFRLHLDGGALAEELFQAYLQQILVDGFFHADPHPGNILVTPEEKVALIDLGMVGRLAPKMQENLLQLLLAISEGRSDDASTVAIKIGEALEGFDEGAFRRQMAEIVMRQKDATVQQMQVGRVVMEVTTVAADAHIRVPAELSLLGKTLLNLDLVGRSLDPEFDPNASIRRNGGEILRQRLARSLSPGNLFGNLLEVKDLVERLPERLNRLLDALAGNKIKIQVDTIDERVFMDGLQKIANRITLGLILAALIIGAAMLIHVPTKFNLLGYPGFAIILFLLAVGGSVVLIFDILKRDR